MNVPAIFLVRLYQVVTGGGPSPGGNVLLESGDNLLLENGDILLLEG